MVAWLIDCFQKLVKDNSKWIRSQLFFNNTINLHARYWAHFSFVIKNLNLDDSLHNKKMQQNHLAKPSLSNKRINWFLFLFTTSRNSIMTTQCFYKIQINVKQFHSANSNTAFWLFSFTGLFVVFLNFSFHTFIQMDELIFRILYYVVFSRIWQITGLKNLPVLSNSEPNLGSNLWKSWNMSGSCLRCGHHTAK